MQHDIPAVVLGAGVNGLGVARSLARAKVPVWLLDADARRPEMRTRTAQPLQVRALHGATLVEDLLRLGRARFGGVRPVLLLTQEESVRTISQHRDSLSPLYRFSLPPVDVVDTLQHKSGFQQLAEKLGAPIPPLVHVRTPADLGALASLRYPVVIKPGRHDAEYGRQFKKAYRAENLAEASELLRHILTVMPDVVVQEWIEGPDSNLYFCLQYLDPRGQVAAAFTGRKLRSWPPEVGGTASCTDAPEAHVELSRLTTEFFRDAGVIGMASMEYKRDARSSEFRMVEPTIGRTDYQEEVATLNGVNLAHAAYCSELELPFKRPPGWECSINSVRGEPVEARVESGSAIPVRPERSEAKSKGERPTNRTRPSSRPVVWRVRSEDEQSAAVQNQRVTDGLPPGSRVVDALWRASDPMPWLVQNLRRATRVVQSRASRKLPRSQPAGSKP